GPFTQSQDQLIGFYNPLVTSVPLHQANSWLQISPNPVSDQTTIRWEQVDADHVLEITDLTGRSARTYSHVVSPFTLDSDDLAAGVYLVRLRNERSVLATAKLVIE